MSARRVHGASHTTIELIGSDRAWGSYLLCAILMAMVAAFR